MRLGEPRKTSLSQIDWSVPFVALKKSLVPWEANAGIHSLRALGTITECLGTGLPLCFPESPVLLPSSHVTSLLSLPTIRILEYIGIPKRDNKKEAWV